MKTINDYADLVKEKHALNKTLAPVETDLTSASRAYAIGQKFIYDGILYKAKTAIVQGAALVLNTNYEAADDFSSEIQTLTKGLEDEAATRSKLGAKNRLPITLASLKQIATAGTWANNVYTENGIDFTINTDASDYVTSVVASGTASGVATINLLGTGTEYAANDFAGMILTGCPSGGGNNNYRTVVFIGDNQDGTGHTSQYEDGAGVTIGTNTYLRIYLRVASGTDLTTPITFYPMIRLATDTDTTYQPYAKTNQELTAENQTFMKQITVNGAVNELDHTGVTDTSGTVKFTVNEDKSITVSADNYPVTLDSTTTFFFIGTASAAVPNIFKGKKLVGCPSGGASGTYRITIQEFSSTTPSGAVAEASDVGEGANISNGDYIRMYIRLGSGYQLTSALTFKPMISLPELGLSYDDYVPYAKTNKELTDESELTTLPATKNDSIVNSFVIRVRKQHNAVYVTGYFNITVDANKGDLLFTISDLNFFDANDHFYILMMSSDGGISFAEVFSNGEVKVGKNTGMPIGYYMVDCVLLVK